MEKYNISSRFVKEEEEVVPRNSIGLRLSDQDPETMQENQ
jgi:hypothetical protein